SASDLTRRRFLRAAVVTASYFTVPGLFAEELVRRTPEMTVGPLYPDNLPRDTDNDLIIVNDSITPAVGQITHLSGRILDSRGEPVRDALIEIWQVDSTATYLKERSHRPAGSFDPNFQGFGRFLTGSTGEYYFRTIKPVPYPGRPAPHIHLKVKKGGKELLCSQINIAGHPGNDVDGIVRGGISVFDRELLMADFRPMPGSKIGELVANFPIILGRTPDEHTLQLHRKANLA